MNEDCPPLIPFSRVVVGDRITFIGIHQGMFYPSGVVREILAIHNDGTIAFTFDRPSDERIYTAHHPGERSVILRVKARP